MSYSAFYSQWLFSCSPWNWKKTCYLSKMILPVRAVYKQKNSLHDLAKDMASGVKLEFPQYVSFSLKKRLAQNARLILHAFHNAANDVEGATVCSDRAPATRWLVDNYDTIDRSIRQAKQSFSKKNLRQFPSCPTLKDVPAIFALMWLYVAHTDSRFSVRTLTTMIKGYQEVIPFQINELWEIPSAIRFVLIENARRIAMTIEYENLMCQFATQTAHKIAFITGQKKLECFLSLYANFMKDTTFSSHLFYRLRAISYDAAPSMKFLEKQFSGTGHTIEEMTATERNRQLSDGLTMGNIIHSLKAIDDVDWTLWFESVSHVDNVLKSKSDFSSIETHARNAYRTAIEQIAHGSPFTELEVTHKAIQCVVSVSDQQKTSWNSTVAYYLVGEGRPKLEELCCYRPLFSECLMQHYRAMKIWSIALPVVFLTIAIISAVHGVLRYVGLTYNVLYSFTALACFPATDMAFSFFNTIIAWCVAPKRLIGFEYKDGIPNEAHTLIAIPTMITSLEAINEQIRNLEIHYLKNPHGAISLALVTDWADAPSEKVDGDSELFDHAQKGIVALNSYYCGDGQAIFFLLHRRRIYNNAEGCWMGWERKRGKLHELNLLLRGKTNTSFLQHDLRLSSNIRFVMTLDSDTRLTPNAVTRLVGKLNHPLNRPVFSSKTRSVIRGYGILQPRITPPLTIGNDTSFLQRVFSSERGLDPYVFTVSDPYQDLLSEGTFIGKGLYEIDAFEASLEGKIEENTVLSHDLLEGGYARTAFVSDVEVIEHYPMAYHVDTARHHRWVRGDWQLLPYLFKKNWISHVTRWKLLDNLRRTLTPFAWITAAIAGWCFLPPTAAIIWQMFLLVSMCISPFLVILRNMVSINRDHLFLGHCQSGFTDMIRSTANVFFRIIFLAHTAWYMLDGIIRALYRMGISHKKRLEWRISAATQSLPNTLPYYMRMMSPALFISVITFALPVWLNSSAMFLTYPFTCLWFLSPFIAWFVSRQTVKKGALKYISDLRGIARRTWHFYETFVTAENNYLPPDNFQEEPISITAQRTSPTNIGLYLLSIVSARDFGWISLSEARERIKETLHTIGLMAKYRGHLYNWYATDTLQPLTPLYISTVDSGNLAGHLVTLCSALKEWAILPEKALRSDLSGLLDVSEIFAEILENITVDGMLTLTLQPLRKRITEKIIEFQHDTRIAIRESINNGFPCITHLMLSAYEISKLTDKLNEKLNTDETRFAVEWAHHLVTTCNAHIHDTIDGQCDRDSLSKHLKNLGELARQYALNMMFDFLECKERKLLSIGYRVQEKELDECCYDLLASEARLSSFFAIAKGDIRDEHWFRLGRILVSVCWKGALLSWSGSMFEYLMPPLIMHEPPGSLLGQSNQLAVRQHIAYAKKHGFPWGISESAFNARDSMMNYQYSSFGVPNLGFKRGLAQNMVVAPYASILASQYIIDQAVANLKRLRDLGALGRYGYYDAVDFTSSRLPRGNRNAIIRNYYAHHHGMSILAIDNVVFDGRMRKRFHDDPVIEAVELLLHEKAPRTIHPC